GRLTVLDIGLCVQVMMESLAGTAAGCLCLGDFFLHGSELRNGAVHTAVSLHSARSVSINIPLSPIAPSVPHMRSNSDFWVARQGASRRRLPRPRETKR